MTRDGQVFRLGALALAVAVHLVFASPASAWNKPGHMIIGAIAHDVLKQDHPDAIPRIVELLKSHPQWDVFAKRLESVPAADRDRYLFMIAARWADDVRDKKEFDRPAWHYINTPITPDADAGKVKPPRPAKENIVTAIEENTKLAKSGTPSERAIAVCWLMHLIGDVHQPLHTVSLFSAQYPRGDNGGNSFNVRVAENRAVINLHSLWDGLLTGDQKYHATGNIAIELRKRPAFARAKLQEVDEHDVDAWVKDGAEIARRDVYRDGKIEGGSDRKDGPVLPDGYAREAKAVAERQVVLAGYRLADALSRSLDD